MEYDEWLSTDGIKNLTDNGNLNHYQFVLLSNGYWKRGKNIRNFVFYALSSSILEYKIFFKQAWAFFSKK